VQHVAQGQGGDDREPETPPGESDRGGQDDRDQHARHHAGDTLYRAAERLVERHLDHQQRGQRCEHRSRAVGQLQREQVRENSGAAQARDGHGRGLRALPYHGHGLGRALGDSPRGRAYAVGRVPAEH
jgi:hypothetical protein